MGGQDAAVFLRSQLGREPTIQATTGQVVTTAQLLKKEANSAGQVSRCPHLHKQPVEIRLDDYEPYNLALKSTELEFTLGYNLTIIKSRLSVKNYVGGDIILHGSKDTHLDQIVLLFNRTVDHTVYTYRRNLMNLVCLNDDHNLVIKEEHVPSARGGTARMSRFILLLTTHVNPEANKLLFGLYRSRNLLITQNESSGFRRITFYPDRPDVMSVFTTTIKADPKVFPVLLSNGEKVSEGDTAVPLADGSLGVVRTVVYHDPYPKPSYLFALAAGRLHRLERQVLVGRPCTEALDTLTDLLGNSPNHALAALCKTPEAVFEDVIVDYQTLPQTRLNYRTDYRTGNYRPSSTTLRLPQTQIYAPSSRLQSPVLQSSTLQSPVSGLVAGHLDNLATKSGKGRAAVPTQSQRLASARPAAFSPGGPYGPFPQTGSNIGAPLRIPLEKRTGQLPMSYGGSIDAAPPSRSTSSGSTPSGSTASGSTASDSTRSGSYNLMRPASLRQLQQLFSPGVAVNDFIGALFGLTTDRTAKLASFDWLKGLTGSKSELVTDLSESSTAGRLESSAALQFALAMDGAENIGSENTGSENAHFLVSEQLLASGDLDPGRPDLLARELVAEEADRDVETDLRETGLLAERDSPAIFDKSEVVPVFVRPEAPPSARESIVDLDRPKWADLQKTPPPTSVKTQTAERTLGSVTPTTATTSTGTSSYTRNGRSFDLRCAS
ncbi:aminopeptidase N [Gregarina niphandrodes]|uniref:Aminopeptidase N n=1 Tax=Gregarina niphandrodes TaxID=110365 RepID=A0A023B5E1_GRENI|nr:aminopeptidase N [Gregarina niphandrodes]EZG59072.1 aminopeptidase N [Gregarina niphandrodes]|eukprot:XP_011130911.1 aminopeptidase N [Gregarina niphandrodes]